MTKPKLNKSQKIRECHADLMTKLPEPQLRDAVIAFVQSRYNVTVDNTLYHKAISRSSQRGRPMRVRMSLACAALVRTMRSQIAHNSQAQAPLHPEYLRALDVCATQLEAIIKDAATEWTERYRKPFRDQTVTD